MLLDTKHPFALEAGEMSPLLFEEKEDLNSQQRTKLVVRMDALQCKLLLCFQPHSKAVAISVLTSSTEGGLLFYHLPTVYGVSTF